MSFNFTVRDIQARCAALGHNPGPVDGMLGRNSRRALSDAMEDRGVTTTAGIFGDAGIHRIHMHWTAGANGVIALERKHYNAIVDTDGNVWDGDSRIEHQAQYRAGRFGCSHTLNANTGAGGIAMDAMAGAKERPFQWGSTPMTKTQVSAMCKQVAEWCAVFDIPVTKWSVLTHAEVQPNLGIRQRWKWDINILPGMTKPSAPHVCGDYLRETVRSFM